jgi:predicted small secreted protein
MSKNVHCLLLLMGLIVFTGCQTIKGTASGFSQDVHNAADPDKNGWNALERVDAWMQKYMW